jgi:predicted ester cyclase
MRRFIECLNKGTTKGLGRAIARGFVWHGTKDFGLRVYKRDLEGIFAAFPDAQWTIEDVIAEGDKVVVRWTFRGTHLGTWENVAPTGKHVTYGGISIGRVANGKLVEVWNTENLLGFFRQLGFELASPRQGSI